MPIWEYVKPAAGTGVLFPGAVVASSSRDMERGPAGLPLEEAEVERHSGGRVCTWLRPGVLVSQVSGRLTLVAARKLDVATRKLIRPGERYMSFHDWEQVDDYDSDARQLLTDASARNRAHIDRTHILLRSRIVVAALDAARVFLKHLQPHGSRAPFEDELRKALKASPPRA